MRKVETAYICDRCKETVVFDDSNYDKGEQATKLYKSGWRRVEYGAIDGLSTANIQTGKVNDLCKSCAFHVAEAISVFPALSKVSQSNES